MSISAPHVPCFALLVSSTALAYSTFGASIPLLPLMFPEGAPVFNSSVVLIAFVVPALFINPLMASKSLSLNVLSIALTFGAFLEAIGPLLLTALLLLAGHGEAGALHYRQLLPLQLRLLSKPRIIRDLVTASMFVSGCGAAISQSGVVRLVSDRMNSLPLPEKRRSTGVHIAVLEGASALGTMISPVLFASIATTRRNVFMPFLVSGIAQLCLAISIACTLHIEDANRNWDLFWQYEDGSSISPAEATRVVDAEANATPGYGSVVESDQVLLPGEDHQLEAPDPGEENEDDPGMLHALRHPWVWMILFSSFVAASSASFLRPVLTPHVTDDLLGSRMFAAILFTLSAFFGLLSEWLTAAVLALKVGIRNTVVLGLLVSLAGFRLLWEDVFIAIPIILICSGASTSLVLTVSDLSQTTRVHVSGITNSLGLLAVFVYSAGEIVGMSVAGILYDTCDSFEEAAMRWYRFVAVGCAIVLAPYLIGMCIQSIRPWMFLMASIRTTG